MTDQPNDPTSPQPMGQAPHVPDYLIWSILTALLCCQPVGIAGIVYAAMANSKKNSGNFQAALSDAATSKKLLWWSFGLGLVVYVGVIIFYILMIVGAVAFGESSSSYSTY